jgi:ribulose-bisphosphate carboxylase small chain
MRLGTFSYLPEMTPQQVRKQAEYAVARGWNAAIEHVEPERATGSYWTMWKLPMFGERSVERILSEAQACHAAHPGHHVRLVAYDNARQTQGAAMVIYRAKDA